MEQNKVIANQDLLLCENKYFLEKNKLENILNFHKKDDKQKQSTLKTQTVSSNVLPKVKDFLAMIKTNDPVCRNIENDTSDEEEDVDDEKINPANSNPSTETNSESDKKKIQFDLLLYQQSDCDSDDSESD